VIPGGGYDVVTTTYEGAEIAGAFASRGIAAAMLKYRLPKPESSDRPELVPITDLRRALEMLRENQEEYGISASMIGVVGFSAGAHLATVAGLHRDKDPRLNPDFSMLIYGVTRMTEENLEWLERSLYHRKLTAAEIKAETLLEWVDESAPPAFLVHALDDTTCHYSESTLYAEALTRHGVAAEMHLYPTGGHGFGAGREKGGTSQWLDLAADWLRRQ
jgi:acetyl esterase/lipase